jgi:hypothetical protein
MNSDRKDTVLFPQTGLPQIPFEAVNIALQTNRGEGEEAEERNYDPIPPKKSITVSVRYRLKGRGKPLPYSLDEETDQ